MSPLSSKMRVSFDVPEPNRDATTVRDEAGQDRQDVDI